MQHICCAIYVVLWLHICCTQNYIYVVSKLHIYPQKWCRRNYIYVVLKLHICSFYPDLAPTDDIWMLFSKYCLNAVYIPRKFTQKEMPAGRLQNKWGQFNMLIKFRHLLLLLLLTITNTDLIIANNDLVNVVNIDFCINDFQVSSNDPPPSILVYAVLSHPRARYSVSPFLKVWCGQLLPLSPFSGLVAFIGPTAHIPLAQSCLNSLIEEKAASQNKMHPVSKCVGKSWGGV